MFTTTITRTETTTETLDFCEGDVILPAHGEGFWQVRKVEGIDGDDVMLTCYSGWMDREGGGYSYKSFKTSLAEEGFRLLHFGGAPLTVERTINNDVVVEHRWQVGDVIKGKVDGVYEWLVTGVAVEGGDAVYNLTCQDGSGFTTTCRTADDDTWKLVGGLRFEEEQANKLTALQALQQARALISSPDAWIKNDYQRHGTQFCAVGAINAVTPGAYAWGDDDEKAMAEVRAEARNALAKIIQPDIDHDSTEGVITEWNDSSQRSHEQVLALFDKAIGDLEWAAVSAS